ncbi:MAG: hypothetical protein K0R75_2773 [Paenibacillaceae bacterium]|nr:hypothetical protein [Paenibacillaceae bacterium]
MSQDGSLSTWRMMEYDTRKELAEWKTYGSGILQATEACSKSWRI